MAVPRADASRRFRRLVVARVLPRTHTILRSSRFKSTDLIAGAGAAVWRLRSVATRLGEECGAGRSLGILASALERRTDRARASNRSSAACHTKFSRRQ